jgi:Zn-dependent protease
MTASAISTVPCPKCGSELTVGALVCSRCGALVFARQINEIAAAAQREEQVNPPRAAAMWRDALTLLPADSQQHRMVRERIHALGGDGSPAVLEYATPPIPRNDPLGVAIAKTVGSMLISIAIYAIMFSQARGPVFGLQFAVGFVLCILVHELGHSMAMRWYRLSASPPIFIPFIGAVINLRQPPRNAWEEAVVGIAGPAFGTVAAFVCYAIYLRTGSPLFFLLTEFAFFLNLLNMLPVPPLDGGRVTAAVSPWLWVPSLIGVVAWVIYDYAINRRLNFIFILLLMMAWPRVKATLAAGARREPYYQIGARARWTMGAAYAALGLTLAAMWVFCKIEAIRLVGPQWL